MLLRREKQIMKKNKAFLFFILPFIVALLILIYLRLKTFISQPLFDSFFWGFLIPLINFSAGHFLNEAGLKRSDKSFLILVLGGLVARMFLTLLLIILVLQFLNVSMYSFIFTVFISYIYFLIVEIINLSGKKPNT
jgi:NhaP-type Na+/H+ or K+/H+ antiporter